MNLLSSALIILSFMASPFIDQDVPFSKLPNEVRNAFEREFQNPSDVEWEKKRNKYEVDFELGGVDHSALYTTKGQLLMIKMEMNEADLAPVIRQKIIDAFPEFRIDDVDQIKVGQQLLYQVELDGPSFDRKVVFDVDGEIEKKFKYWD